MLKNPVTQTDKEILSQYIELVKGDLIEAQRSKRLRASGKSAALLSVNFVSDSTVQLIDGSGYFYYQEHGRGPTGDKSKDFALVNQIYDWLPYAGKYNITFVTDKDRLKKSFQISKKINRKGTYTFRNGQTGVIEDTINTDRIETVAEVFALKKGFEALSDIASEFN